MRVDRFTSAAPGALVPISGEHPQSGPWTHVAFVPDPLPDETPDLSTATFNAVADARAALASLDSAATQLPDPTLLRRPTLRREAQSTSALEGTYKPLETVLAADEDNVDPADVDLREVLNYVRAAEHAFAWVGEGRPVTLGLLEDLQGLLVRGTASDTTEAGAVRTTQVAIGARRGQPVEQATFVPSPPGPDFEHRIRDVVSWVTADHRGAVDPVVAAGMAHYTFEALHPFNDGNGRIGRLLVVLQLLTSGVLTEPTLTVSPWFEARRDEYYAHLLAVSQRGAWDAWLRFFATGLQASAVATRAQVTDLLAVQNDLKARVRAAGLRAESAMRLVDLALAQPIFTVRQVEGPLGLTYARANGLVAQLVRAGVLTQYDDAVYGRRFVAPAVLETLLR